MDKIEFFGNPEIFAIRYIPGYKIKNTTHFYATCHLVLNGQIIGLEDEECFLVSWIEGIENLKNHIEKKFQNLKNSNFKDKTDTEIFELILKSNQLEADFKKEFEYLPVLENKVWENCNITLDETTDHYLINMIAEDENLKFLWQLANKSLCEDSVGRTFSTTVNKNFVIETIEKTIKKIKRDMQTYPEIEH